jgi:hypothetical protein
VSLLDGWMPVYDVSAKYETTVRASPETVYEALWQTDLRSDPLIRGLLTVRALPGLLFRPGATWRRMRGRTERSAEGLRGLLRPDGFVLLAESPPEELVLGVTGTFWTPSARLVPSSPATFRETPAPNLARGTWGFRLEPLGDSTRLSTETRVRCADAATRRAFRRYWRIIGGASGLIRKIMLRRIRLAAEIAHANS